MLGFLADLPTLHARGKIARPKLGGRVGEHTVRTRTRKGNASAAEVAPKLREAGQKARRLATKRL